MASSGEYWAKYWSKKDQAKDYGDYIKALQKIRGNIDQKLYDEASDVNDKIDDLTDALNTAVRHNASFRTAANRLGERKEKAYNIDGCLSASHSSLNAEINRLSQLKTQAEQDRDYYYRKYQEQLEIERSKREEKARELFNNLFNF